MMKLLRQSLLPLRRRPKLPKLVLRRRIPAASHAPKSRSRKRRRR
jgi:hypothetical protein